MFVLQSFITRVCSLPSLISMPSQSWIQVGYLLPDGEGCADSNFIRILNWKYHACNPSSELSLFTLNDCKYDHKCVYILRHWN